MHQIDFAMIGMLISLVCFTTLAYRIGRAHGRIACPLGAATVHYSECSPYEIIWNGRRFTHAGPA